MNRAITTILLICAGVEAMNLTGPSIGGPSLGRSKADKVKDTVASAMDDLANIELELA